jgi:hypothetical protein
MPVLSHAPCWTFLRILGRNPYTLTAVIFFSVLAAPFCWRKQSDWDMVYLPAAQRLVRGEDVFQVGFVYPPVNAWLAVPFSRLPPGYARLAWFTVNAVALMVLIRAAWRLSGGSRLEPCSAVPRTEHRIFILGLLCAIYYAFDALTNQQTDIVVAALVMAGCGLLAQRRDIRAGSLLGLAAGLKCTPLLLAGYLGWKRRWLAAVLVPAIACGINLIPDLVYPLDPPRSRLNEWGHRFLLPMTNKDHHFGSWASSIFNNHSIPGICNRWLTCRAHWQHGELVEVTRDGRISPQSLKVAALGGMMLLLAVALYCVGKPVQVATAKSPGTNSGPSAAALEFSLVVILMLLLSPQSSKPHFCTLFLPGFCLARAALSWPSRSLLTVVLGVVALGLTSNKDLVGTKVYDWVIWHGSITWSAILLYAGCCLCLLRWPPRRNTAREPSTAPRHTGQKAA